MSDAAVAVTTRTNSKKPGLVTSRLVVLVLGLGFVLAARLLASIWLSGRAGDFELLYGAAERLLRGEAPYSPGHWLPYPLPAVLLVAPFTALPLWFARPLFDILVGWAFVYALWKYRGRYALLALLSGSYLFALVYGVATPLMVAASLIPALGFLLAVRPNTSAALWTAWPTRIGLLGASTFLLVSLLIQPFWLQDWWMAMPLDVSAWMPPVLRPFGAILLLAALRWNQPEGRLLLATILLPQSALPYELVALALIPASGAEMAIYLAGTWIAVADASGALQLLGGGGWTMAGWPVTLCAVYFPMLFLVLRRPGSKGGPWIGKERRRPHRLPDDDLKVEVSVDDAGRFSATVTHVPSEQSMTETAPTRQLAVRKAHDKLAALLARASRLVRTGPTEPR